MALAPDIRAGFRLPRELLASIDAVCHELDLTRSQIFRKCVTQFIKSLAEHDHLHTPPKLEERPATGWSPELYDRLKPRR
jgi:hypothetical protein